MRYGITLSRLRQAHVLTIGTPYRAGIAPEVVVALCDVADAAKSIVEDDRSKWIGSQLDKSVEALFDVIER